jgi:hypothetical protein
MKLDPVHQALTFPRGDFAIETIHLVVHPRNAPGTSIEE